MIEFCCTQNAPYGREQIEAFLTELYHGKPKDCDLVRFMERMASGEEDESRLTLDGIRSGMAQLKTEVINHSFHVHL